MKACLALAIAWTGAAMGLSGSEPSLGDVLRRAGEYVERYHQAMTSVVAEERYVQEWTTLGTGTTPGSFAQRTLLSDFVLLSQRGEPRWISFRDVLEVDGVAVRERDGRLQRLFMSEGDAVVRASALILESSRYNLGPPEFVRTINTPIVAIDFLLPETRSRFSFHRAAPRTVQSDRIWEVRFDERRQPTVIRTPLGQSVRAKGSFRIDPLDGRILETTLELLDGDAAIAVSYEFEPRLQTAVPVAMTERYAFGREHIDGKATYANYRRFETAVHIVPR